MRPLYEERSSQTSIYYTYTFNVTFIDKLHDDIKKRCVIENQTQQACKVNVQIRWISLFSKSSWIKASASGLSYEQV